MTLESKGTKTKPRNQNTYPREIEKKKALSCATFGESRRRNGQVKHTKSSQKSITTHVTKKRRTQSSITNKTERKFEANATKITTKKAKSQKKRGSMFPPQQRKRLERIINNEIRETQSKILRRMYEIGNARRREREVVSQGKNTSVEISPSLFVFLFALSLSLSLSALFGRRPSLWERREKKLNMRISLSPFFCYFIS